MVTTGKTRTAKLDLRLTPKAKKALQAAAAVSRRSVSEFVLESCGAAGRMRRLADRQEFRLSAGEWKAFLAALDAPPRALPRMGRLLKERGFFEGGR